MIRSLALTGALGAASSFSRHLLALAGPGLAVMLTSRLELRRRCRVVRGTAASGSDRFRAAEPSAARRRGGECACRPTTPEHDVEARSSHPSRRGWFVTFEGPEGAGKTTQAETLVGLLEASGREPLLVREPGGTPLGERIRSLLLGADPAQVPIAPRTDALLFNSARAQLVRDVISPALAAGRFVVCCRFADSTLAYQGYGMKPAPRRAPSTGSLRHRRGPTRSHDPSRPAGGGWPGTEAWRGRDAVRDRVRCGLPPKGSCGVSGACGRRTSAVRRRGRATGDGRRVRRYRRLG